VPDTKQGRDTYKIAADNERNFSRTFLKATRELLTPEILSEMLDAIKRQSATDVIAALPGSDESDPTWEKFNDSMFRAYEKITLESGKFETRNINRKYGSNLVFTISDPEENVEKAGEIPVVQMNPYSIQWIKRRLREFRMQSITEPQKEVVMEILGDGFEKGLRPELIINEIKDNIGLTSRQYAAVQKRRLLHEAAGLSPDKVESLISKYTEQLLKQRAQMIARTETIAAQATGRHTSWQLADEAGVLPSVVREWVSAPASPNPTRPCPICLGLV
jgi:hypothetical protein